MQLLLRLSRLHQEEMPYLRSITFRRTSGRRLASKIWIGFGAINGAEYCALVGICNLVLMRNAFT
jgi:hypothetical protein